MTPIITGYGSVAVRSSLLQVIGTGFGRVSSALLQDANGQQFECDFQVDTSTSVHLTVPQLLPDGSYFVAFGTLDNVPSQNTAAALLVVPALPATPPSPPPASDPLPDPASPAVQAVRARLRLEIGDFEEGFESRVVSDGRSRRLEIPEEVVSPAGLTVEVFDVNGVSVGDLTAGSDFQMDYRAGVLVLDTALPAGQEVIIGGTHHQFFTDDELDLFVRSAALKHTHSAESLSVYRDALHFRHFLYSNQTIDTVPPVEHHVLALAAAVEALEVIRSDSAFDIDVTTAEGTSLPRTERFRNIGELIATKQARYDDLCAKLGVGLGRVEVFTVRRVSRTTGRLVPVYVDREYDDVRTPPLRVFAPRNLGVSGSGFVQPDPFAYGGTGQSPGAGP